MKYWQVMALVDMDELPILARKTEEFGFEGLALDDATFIQREELVVLGGWSAV
jgi:hypothetical protein